MSIPLNSEKRSGAIVLCGGESSRMGSAKALLPFGNETLLTRIVRIVSQVVEPTIVVRAAGQSLPSLPKNVQVVEDRERGRGPLEGVRAGLVALEGVVDQAYITACDTPLVRAEFVRRVVALAEGYEIAVPYIDRFYHPLAAVYRVSLRPTIDELLARGQWSPRFLFDSVRTRNITADELADVDPRFDSLRNVNTPEEFQAALTVAGFG